MYRKHNNVAVFSVSYKACSVRSSRCRQYCMFSQWSGHSENQSDRSLYGVCRADSHNAFNSFSPLRALKRLTGVVLCCSWRLPADTGHHIQTSISPCSLVQSVWQWGTPCLNCDATDGGPDVLQLLLSCFGFHLCICVVGFCILWMYTVRWLIGQMSAGLFNCHAANQILLRATELQPV